MKRGYFVVLFLLIAMVFFYSPMNLRKVSALFEGETNINFIYDNVETTNWKVVFDDESAELFIPRRMNGEWTDVPLNLNLIKDEAGCIYYSFSLQRESSNENYKLPLKTTERKIVNNQLVCEYDGQEIVDDSSKFLGGINSICPGEINKQLGVIEECSSEVECEVEISSGPLNTYGFGIANREVIEDNSGNPIFEDEIQGRAEEFCSIQSKRVASARVQPGNEQIGRGDDWKKQIPFIGCVNKLIYPECDDGKDNDNDELIDYCKDKENMLNKDGNACDPGCDSPRDISETNDNHDKVAQCFRDNGLEVKEGNIGKTKIIMFPELKYVITKTTANDCNPGYDSDGGYVIETLYRRWFKNESCQMEGEVYINMKFRNNLWGQLSDEDVKDGIVETLETALKGHLSQGDIEKLKAFIRNNFRVPPDQDWNNPGIIKLKIENGKYFIEIEGKKADEKGFKVSNPGGLLVNPPSLADMKDRGKTGKVDSIRIEVFDENGRKIADRCFVKDDINNIDAFYNQYIKSYFDKLKKVYECIRLKCGG